jgi:hypothetical protein
MTHIPDREGQIATQHPERWIQNDRHELRTLVWMGIIGKVWYMALLD